MPWIKMDDGAPQNHKLGRLSDREFRQLLAVWSYCARVTRDGTFTLDDLPQIYAATPRGPRNTKPEELRRYIEIGLVDPDADGRTFRVHDWYDYQLGDPTGAERARRYRQRHRDARSVTEP